MGSNRIEAKRSACFVFGRFVDACSIRFVPSLKISTVSHATITSKFRSSEAIDGSADLADPAEPRRLTVAGRRSAPRRLSGQLRFSLVPILAVEFIHPTVRPPARTPVFPAVCSWALFAIFPSRALSSFFAGPLVARFD